MNFLQIFSKVGNFQKYRKKGTNEGRNERRRNEGNEVDDKDNKHSGEKGEEGTRKKIMERRTERFKREK